MLFYFTFNLILASGTHLKPKKSVKLKQTKFQIGRGLPVKVANNFTCSIDQFESEKNETFGLTKVYHHNDDYVKPNGCYGIIYIHLLYILYIVYSIR